MVAVFGWGTPTAVVAGCVMLLAHAAFKAAAVHGRRHPRPPARHPRPPPLPRPGRGWRDRASPPRSSPPRRWPACRCSSGSSPRRPTSTLRRHQGAGAAVALAGDRRRLGADRRLQPPLPRRRRRSPAADPATPAPPAATARRAWPFVAPGRSCSPRSRVVLGVVPALARPRSSAPAATALDRVDRRGAPRAVARHQRSSCCCRRVALAARRRAVRRPPARRAASSPSARTCRRRRARYLGVAPRPQRRRRPRHRVAQPGSLPDLPRRDPAHRGARARRAPARRHVVAGLARPRRGRRRTCRSPPC